MISVSSQAPPAAEHHVEQKTAQGVPQEFVFTHYRAQNFGPVDQGSLAQKRDS